MGGLNAAQRAAVEHEQGPLLVLAGAGSGKTRVITHRIARLIDRGVRPEAILAVSFTNKAAAEMRERMENLVGHDVASKLWLSTFHSFGVRFLGEETDALGHDGRFVIFDQGDALGLVKELLKQKRSLRGLDAMALLTRISLWKNAFKGPKDLPESDFEYDAIAREIYPEYEASLRSMRAVDFDDLVVLPARILAERPDIRERWRNRFRHLMIDEFQDTNRSQLELTRLLTNDLRNVCVVGDDDQSIYGWRGADVGNILDFERHFAGTTVVKLEDNYRSKAPIIEVANQAIALSTQARHGKTLRPARGPGDPVRLSVAADPVGEAKLVTREIDDLVKKEGFRYGDIAVLYRSNLQARVLEEELQIFDVPYRMLGGTQFFDRKEVKDAAAYLRVLIQPRDEMSMRRIINYPARGVGTTSIERMATWAKARNKPFARALQQIEEIDDIPKNGVRAVVQLRDTLAAARAELDAGARLAPVAAALFESVGIKRDLLDDTPGPVGARRWENIVYLIRAIERFESTPDGDKPSLATFLQRITMRFQETAHEEDPKNAVTLSTLHGCKGLEFPVVFVIGCVEGQLPHSRTTDPKITEAAPTDVEEERRLFYVGVTRARDRLYLTRARQRMARGRLVLLTPSRFLDGLPEASMTEYERPDEKPLEASEAADMAKSILDALLGN
jgi:DNA helicase-2/ATP-dependent DNA helicase PcrA